MNGDETLRDALRDDAKGGAASSDAWDRVRARAGSIRNRRQLAKRTIGGLTAAAMVAGVLVASGALKSDKTVIATPPTGDQIVAVQGPNNGGDHLVVVSADDGHVIRTLADDIGITFGGISATPDGETVYFARRRAALPCDRVEIAKVPSAGGDVEVIGTGIHGVVSSDGSTLAYIRPPADDPCGPLSERVWRDLTTGEETVFPVSEVRDQVASPSFPLAYSPDGSRLLLATQNCEGPPGDVECTNEFAGSVMALPMRSPSDADFGAVRFLDLESPVFADGATYLPDGRILVALEDTVPNGTHSGAQLHRLVVFDENVQEDFRIQPVESLFESRQNGVLHITANSSGDVLLHFGGDLLQLWRPGDAGPTTITSDIRDAAWLPTQQSGPPEPSTTTTTADAIQPVLGPDQMVVARFDGGLDVVTAFGTLVRHLGSSGLTVRSMMVTPDGKTAYYEQGPIDVCADGGEIDAARLDVDPPHFSGGYMGSMPALSPDGTKLAYRSGPCGGSLVVVDLNTDDRMVFTTTNERSWTLADPEDGGPFPELVGPVGWDADNQHVMLRVNREPGTEFWYVDTATDGATISGQAFRVRGEQGAETGPSSFTPLGASGRWAAIYNDGGGGGSARLVEYDLTTDSVVRTLRNVMASTVLVGTDASGSHLLVLVPTATGFDLYRWREGEASLTFVAEGIAAADW